MTLSLVAAIMAVAPSCNTTNPHPRVTIWGSISWSVQRLVRGRPDSLLPRVTRFLLFLSLEGFLFSLSSLPPFLSLLPWLLASFSPLFSLGSAPLAPFFLVWRPLLGLCGGFGCLNGFELCELPLKHLGALVLASGCTPQPTTRVERQGSIRAKRRE